MSNDLFLISFASLSSFDVFDDALLKRGAFALPGKQPVLILHIIIIYIYIVYSI